MKKILLLITLIITGFTPVFCQIGIGTTTPNSSAILDLTASNKGFLPPRVALASASDISTVLNPATGLLIYNTATSGIFPNNIVPGYYYFTGTSWVRIITPGNATGDMLYWNGKQWVSITPGLRGQFLQLSADNLPNWAGATYPTVTTYPTGVVTQNTVNTSGKVISDGGAPVTARGFVWNTAPNPTISLSTKTNNGTDTGLIFSYIHTLTGNTTYYLRAYATNSAGTAYGNQVSFTTLAVDSFSTVTICNQKWMTVNLDVSTYRNGDLIPEVTDSIEWLNLTTGAYCYYDNDPNQPYKKLYNWYAVNDARGLAPTGWHIASDSEWTTLGTCLGGDSIAGGKMKTVNDFTWIDPNTGATNESGFSAHPGGFREYIYGWFFDRRFLGFWWSTTSTLGNTAWYRSLQWDNAELTRGSQQKTTGFSVRCIKD